ncbi:MAG: ABC-type transport auxiliary lipoprotein family protein [Rhodospirillaceae bacterium]
MAHSVLMRNRVFAAIRHVGFASILIVGAASCSSPPVPTDTFYNLTAGRSVGVKSQSKISAALEVPPFRAEGVINERAIVYRETETIQKQYTYHYWSEPPAIMIQRSVIDALRSAQAFDQVAAPEIRTNRDYELTGVLRRLEHVVGGTSKVVVEFDVGLRRIRGNDLVFLKTYRTERDTGRGVAAAVSTMSAALDDLLREMLGDIDRARILSP